MLANIKIALPENTPRWFFAGVLGLLLVIGVLWARPDLLRSTVGREVQQPVEITQSAYPDGCVGVQLVHPRANMNAVEVRLSLSGNSKADIDLCNPQSLRTSQQSDVVRTTALNEFRGHRRTRVTLAFRQARAVIGLKDNEGGGLAIDVHCEEEPRASRMYMGEWGVIVPTVVRMKEIRAETTEDTQMLAAVCMAE